MTLQQKLGDYERQLDALENDGGWEKSGWPDKSASGTGFRVSRLHRAIGEDRLMCHRFEPDEGMYMHPHQFALAAHVLGPHYELGFGLPGVCLTRMICTGPFYYEMLLPELLHYLRPKYGPLYSVAIWTPFPPRTDEPEPLMAAGVLRDHVETLHIVERMFWNHYPELR